MLASVTNPQGDTTNYQYNSDADLTAVQFPDDSIETATYDAMGDPLSLTDQDGQATDYTYNSAGLVTSETLSDGTTMTYAYDAQGNLNERHRPIGHHHAGLQRQQQAHQRRLSQRSVSAIHV